MLREYGFISTGTCMLVYMYKQTLSVQKIERFKALVFRIVKLILSLHTGTHVTECIT